MATRSTLNRLYTRLTARENRASLVAGTIFTGGALYQYRVNRNMSKRSAGFTERLEKEVEAMKKEAEERRKNNDEVGKKAEDASRKTEGLGKDIEVMKSEVEREFAVFGKEVCREVCREVWELVQADKKLEGKVNALEAAVELRRKEAGEGIEMVRKVVAAELEAFREGFWKGVGFGPCEVDGSEMEGMGVAEDVESSERD